MGADSRLPSLRTLTRSPAGGIFLVDAHLSVDAESCWRDFGG